MIKGRWIILVICIAFVVVQAVRPVPPIQVKNMVDSTIKIPGTPPVIHWPETGEAAVAVDGIGTIGQFGPNTPVPVASCTKIMTAYLTLKKHPLTTGSNGPDLKVTSADVDLFNKDDALGESLVPVSAGETLTERQALEALLLPSANNIATMLAEWNDGGLPAFVSEMNDTAKKLGMTHTHFADASGFDPQTVSTAADMIKVAEAALKDPTFREIVQMPQATIPVAGTIYNVDYVLGQNGIIGVKTGSTDQAGGCFVFAADDAIDGKTYTIVGAVLGQSGDQPLMKALKESVTLAKDAENSLKKVQVIANNQAVASLQDPWQQNAQAVAAQSISLVGWSGMNVQTNYHSTPLGDQAQKQKVIGSLQVDAGSEHASTPVQLTKEIAPPSFLWRLIHG